MRKQNVYVCISLGCREFNGQNQANYSFNLGTDKGPKRTVAISITSCEANNFINLSSHKVSKSTYYLCWTFLSFFKQKNLTVSTSFPLLTHSRHRYRTERHCDWILKRFRRLFEEYSLLVDI